jgi:hypothetical protein
MLQRLEGCNRCAAAVRTHQKHIVILGIHERTQSEARQIATLLFVVCTVAHLWRQEAQSRNAEEIAKR